MSLYDDLTNDASGVIIGDTNPDHIPAAAEQIDNYFLRTTREPRDCAELLDMVGLLPADRRERWGLG